MSRPAHRPVRRVVTPSDVMSPLEVLLRAAGRFGRAHRGCGKPFTVQITTTGMHLDGPEDARAAASPAFDDFTALFAAIPPLTPARGICVALRSSNDLATNISVTLDGITLRPRVTPLVKFVSEFIRLHSHLDMDTTLRPWLLSPMTAGHDGALWADTAETALIRFAACSETVRMALLEGVPHACVPDTGPDIPEISPRVRQVLATRRLAPSPASGPGPGYRLVPAH